MRAFRDVDKDDVGRWGATLVKASSVQQHRESGGRTVLDLANSWQQPRPDARGEQSRGMFDPGLMHAPSQSWGRSTPRKLVQIEITRIQTAASLSLFSHSLLCVTRAQLTLALLFSRSLCCAL